MAASPIIKSANGHAQADTQRREVWIVIVLVLIIIFSGTSFWGLRSMQSPSSTAIVTVLGFALVAVILAPLMFDISELSVSEGKITARIRSEIKPVKDEVDNLQKAVSAMLEGQYGIGTYERRSEGYRKLWEMLEPLALYFREEPITYAALSDLGRKLRHWYFEYGMFLTDSKETDSDALKRYFFLQDIIQILTRQKSRDRDALKCQGALLYKETDKKDMALFPLFNLSEPDEKTQWKEQLYHQFNPKTTEAKDFQKRLDESPEQHFALIRCAASALRTQMATDLEARVGRRGFGGH